MQSLGRKLFGIILLLGIFLIGCGAEKDTDEQKTEESSQSEQTADWNPAEATLYARYLNVAPGEGAWTKALIKMDCLAAKQGVFVTGIQENQGSAEAVIYLLAEEKEPIAAAAYPNEKKAAWCRTEEGIAFLTVKAAEIGEEEAEKEYLLHILKWDPLSESLSETETLTVTEAFSGAEIEASFVSEMAVGDKYLFLFDQIEQRILVIERESGAMDKWIPAGEHVHALWCAEGEVVALCAGGNLYSYAPETGKRTLKAENLFGQTGSGSHSCPATQWIFSGSEESLYAFSMDGKTNRKLMDYEMRLKWEKSLWLDEATGEGVLATWDSDGEGVQCCYLSTSQPVEKQEVEKEEILLEEFYVSDELKQAAMVFNEQNDKYQVKIVEAGKETDFETYGLQLQARLITGEGPDLTSMALNSRFKDYVKSGAFEELTSWMERDLNPEDYIQAALHAYEMEDGGVYALGSAFILSVVVADRQETSGAEWNLETMFRMMEESDLSILNFETDRRFLLDRFCLSQLGQDIYDMEKVRECILFAEKYGYDDQETQKKPEKVIPGKEAAIVTEIIDDPLDLPDIMRYYGDNTVILGYPMSQGSEVISEFYPEALSISATSKHKEGAWAFLKFLLGEEIQSSIESGFPVLKAVFDERLEQYSAPETFDVYIEETGEVITFERGYSLGRCTRESGWSNPVEIDAVSLEEQEALRSLVDQSSGVVCHVDFQANQIILEEAESYYQGDKSLEEVMKVIEGRVRILQAE